MEQFSLPEQVKLLRKHSMEDLKWNLKYAEDELSRLSSDDKTEARRILELEKDITAIKKEISYRIIVSN